MRPNADMVVVHFEEVPRRARFEKLGIKLIKAVWIRLLLCGGSAASASRVVRGPTYSTATMSRFANLRLRPSSSNNCPIVRGLATLPKVLHRPFLAQLRRCSRPQAKACTSGCSLISNFEWPLVSPRLGVHSLGRNLCVGRPRT